MDAQACQHDPTVHVQRFSHLKGRADDHDIIRWCHCLYAYVEVGGYIRECTWALGLLSGFWAAVYLVALCKEPQILSCGYLDASEVRLLPYREMSFIYSTVSAQGYLGNPELVCSSCLQVNWITCHPVSLRPCIWNSKDHNILVQIGTCGINHDFGEPTNPCSIPKIGHISSIPGWAQKEVVDPRGLVWQCGAVAVCDHPLNCQSGGLRRQVSTFSR